MPVVMGYWPHVKLIFLACDVDHGDASPFALMGYGKRKEGKCLSCCAIPTE